MKTLFLSTLAAAVFATAAFAGEAPNVVLTSAQLAVNAAAVRVELARTYPVLPELDAVLVARDVTGNAGAQ